MYSDQDESHGYYGTSRGVDSMGNTMNSFYIVFVIFYVTEMTIGMV